MKTHRWAARGAAITFCIFAAGLGFPGSAGAIDTLGPVPDVPQSRCGGLAVSRHLLRVGEQLVATAGPAHPEACFGSATWTWAGGPGLEMVSGCEANSAGCVLKATRETGSPSNRWAKLCINGNSGFGGWISCDYFAVIGKGKFELAGHVKDRNGTPLGGVSVFIPGRNGGMLSTDGTGLYSALLPLGAYTVSAFAPQAPATVFLPVASADCRLVGASCAVSLNQDRTADFLADAAQHVTLSFSPVSLPADGMSFGSMTVEDTNALGVAISGQPIDISPPLGGDPPFLICSPDGRLYPLDFPASGDLLGATFTKSTGADGRIHATLLAGTLPGEYTTSAGVPGSTELSESSFRTLSLSGAPAGPVSAFLPAEIRTAVAAESGTAGGYLSLAPLLSLTDANAAQSLLLDLLVRLKAAGAVPLLSSGAVDFAPIHSASGGVGILFYPHGTPRAQILTLGVNALVLDIGTLLQSGGGAVTLPDVYPTLAEWEFTGILPHGQALAGHLNHIPGEELAYFGLPYPPPEGSVTAGGTIGRNTYDQQCVPSDHTLQALTVHSPVSVVLVDGAGNRVGTDARGLAVTDGAGIVQRVRGGQTTIVVPAGTYGVRLVGTGTGASTLVSWIGGEAKVATFVARRGASGSATFGPAGLADVRFAGRGVAVTTGLGMRVKVLPQTLRSGHRRVRVRVRDQFGAPVGGALVSFTGPDSASALTNSRGGAALVVNLPRRRARAVVLVTAPGFKPAQVGLRVTR